MVLSSLDDAKVAHVNIEATVIIIEVTWEILSEQPFFLFENVIW